MTLKECSVKYQDAKKAGQLNGRNWYQFRAAECGIGQDTGADGKPVAEKLVAAPPKAPPAGPLPTMPSVIDPKYASEKASKARLHTCADAYRAHKKAGTLNGLRWIQKGGGFYSLCNRKLKAKV